MTISEKCLTSLLAVLLGFFMVGDIFGATTKVKPKKNIPVVTRHEPAASSDPNAPISLESRAAFMMEVETGSVIYEYNSGEKIAPASLTKILTLYLVFEALERRAIHLTDEVFISKRAWKTGGSQMFIEVGNKIPLEELVKGIAVASGNDACVALAEHISGSVEAFVMVMNQKAKELGMNSSTFINPHGLDEPGQFSTAGDMAILARAYIKRFPQALTYHSMKEYSFNGILQYNRNHLLNRDPSIDGLKTGFVAAGGYHLIATAKRDNMRLIAVVMGAAKPSIRERDALQLLNFGFRNYALIKPVDQSEMVGVIKVWKGVSDKVEAYPMESKTVFVPKSEAAKIKKEVVLTPELTAPVKAGQGVGQVNVYKDAELIYTVPIIAGSDIERAGFFKRIWQSLKRPFKGEGASLKFPDLESLLKYVVLVAGAAVILFFALKIVRRRKRRKLVRRMPVRR